MKKDVFADWLRELCMLVFIQAIQAFIFAIVMSLIISVLSDFPEDETDAVASTGVIAVIVLASVSKIEDIVKKIFGIKSGFHDSGMRGGLKSLATTMMAANLAKGALDNFGKIGGGIAGAVGANRQIRQTRARMARDINRYGGKPAMSGTTNTTGGALPSEQESNVSSTKPESANSTGNSASSGGSSGNADKLQDKLDAYNDKIRELKSKKRSSYINAISGVTETAGAIGGGITGMVAGAAMGEGKEIIQGGLTGIGVGDFAGKMAAQPLRMANSIGEGMNSYIKDKKDLINEVSRTTANARAAIDKRRTTLTKAREANRQLDKMLEQIDAGNMDL